jgi:S1-C subfamily serine protease
MFSVIDACVGCDPVAPAPPPPPVAEARATSDVADELELAGVGWDEWSDAPPGQRGVGIGRVSAESAAELAGLLGGDIILNVRTANGSVFRVASIADLRAIPTPPGALLVLHVVRSGADLEITMSAP